MMAAIASARNGADTVVVEKHNCFGGNTVTGMVLTLGGFNSWRESHERAVGGIPQELVNRLVHRNAARDTDGAVLDYDPETLKVVADEMILEAGITPFLHTLGVAPLMDGNRLRGVVIECKSGRLAILADMVVDATGDADIAFRAGAPSEKGDVLQPATMCFRIRGVSRHLPLKRDPIEKADLDSVDVSRFDGIPVAALEKWRRARWLVQQPLYSTPRNPVLSEKMQEGLKKGELAEFGGPWTSGLYEDELWVNTTRQFIDASDVHELTQGEIEGRRQVQEIVAYWKERVDGFQESRLVTTGMQIGIRETRRIVGEYMLTGEDIVENRPAEDAIALGCWPVDVHPGKGEYHDQAVRKYRGYRPDPYQIPYRCLIPQNIDHLVVAGRCISGNRVAMGSIRVMATCMALGEAAGTAAALAAKAGVGPRNVDITALQQALRNQGALIAR